MRRYFSQMGTVGINRDVLPHDLPPNTWSDGQNVRFFDQKAKIASGHEQVFGTPLYDPWHLRHIKKNDSDIWFYGSEFDIGATDGTNHATVSSTSAGYSTSLDINWTSTVLPGGVVVFNNASEAPQVWTGTTINDKFANLGAWPADTTCRTMASVNNFLVALDVTENGTRIPELVRWSTRADVGTIPDSWDYADTTKAAGRTALGASGTIMTAAKLRESLVIYMDRRVFLMTEVGGFEVFSFRELFSEIGALSRRCVGELRGRHVVFSFDDLIVHDGTAMQSIADRRIRRNIFNDIDSQNFERSFIALNYAGNEVWFCYPESGAIYPSVAWIWNWVNDTWYKRALPQSAHITHGVINDTGGDTFDSATGTFDDATGAFNETTLTGAQIGLLLADTENGKLLKLSETPSFDGSAFNSFVERSALPFGEDPLFDLDRIKYIREIIPDIRGSVGGVVNIYIGKRDSIDDNVTFEGPFPYTIGTTRKIDCRVSGRVIDIKFETTTAIDWELTAFRLYYRLAGQR